MKRTVIVALALAGMVLVACKKEEVQPDAAMLPDAPPGRRCVDEPNDWRVAGFGLDLPRDSDGDAPNIFDTWGHSPSAIWAVGSKGLVLFFDGAKWSKQPVPVDQTLTSVWGTSERDVWAVGFSGTVVHFNGTIWEDRQPPTALFLDTDAGVPTGDAAVAARKNLWGVWATGRDDLTQALYAVGDQGLVLFWQNNIWTRVPSGVQEKLTGIWGQNATRIYAVGDFGTILCGNTTGLTKQQSNVDKALRSVWGRGGNDVYTVGVAGIVLRFAGGGCDQDWQPQEGAPPQVFRDVWGPSNDRSTIYIVGWDGVLTRMRRSGDGPTFSPFNCVTSNRLEGIWGTLVDGPYPDGGAPQDGPPPQIPAVWIVGANATLLTGP